MLDIQFRVSPDNGEDYEVTSTPRDIRTWEKNNKGKTFLKLAEGNSSDLYQLAYIASKRLGLFEGTFEEFEESADVYERRDEESVSFPTEQAA